MAAFSRVIPPLATSFAVQALFALVFVPQGNEKYYDLGGALGFLSTTFSSLYYPALKNNLLSQGKILPLPPLSSFAPRQLMLSAALGIWITRLGSFLVHRGLKAGGDTRFDEVKHKPALFTFYWFMQATWVFVVGLPVYMANTIPASAHPPLIARDYASFGLFAASFLFEVIADRQKSAWRRKKDAKQHDEKFITSGLWSISRHPNYVGEVGIWTGIWALSTAGLQNPYFPRSAIAVAAISPIFTYILLTKLSGVPPLEEAGDKKYGNDPKWHEYKQNVPVFWPWVSARK
ncbi:DUF1295-domain-containing protein [Lentinula raphanica]|uniref:DUF1295-domain-containing protein n=1 Tax=Lentinula raphanica TaxID=153919 RepID=A0AA38PLA9_9AGAR|nr:DUF1295-domain-containing protein [Lentinula raphanica]KAJ3844768.1 DUF1295-domain-containing protein [Lentinula raphanica]